jgi:hypothetical protein
MPQPQPTQPQAAIVPVHEEHHHHHPHQDEHKECAVEKTKKPNSMLDALVKHPIAPVVGGLLIIGAHFADEPSPPTIPDDLPEAVAKQWQMIFSQNQQRFQRRMELYENLGMVLLGYASAQTVIEALPSKKSTDR